MSHRVEWAPIGEIRVSNDPQVLLVTVTGPCVALALFDPEAGAAGLLHVVQPGRRRGTSGTWAGSTSKPSPAGCRKWGFP